MFDAANAAKQREAARSGRRRAEEIAAAAEHSTGADRKREA